MAQAFVSATDDDVLSGFTALAGSLSLVELDGELVLRQVGGPCVVPYTAIAPATEMELVAEMRVSGGSSGGGRTSGGLGVCMSGTAQTYISHETMLFGTNAGNIESLFDFTDGVGSTIDTFSSSPVDLIVWHCLRINVSAAGVLTSVRWEGAVGDPPEPMFTWQVPAGKQIPSYCGVANRNSQRTTSYRWLAIGTDGDPAPTGPLGTTEAFQLRHNPRTNKVIPVLSSPTVTDIGAACVRPRVSKGF